MAYNDSVEWRAFTEPKDRSFGSDFFCQAKRQAYNKWTIVNSSIDFPDPYRHPR